MFDIEELNLPIMPGHLQNSFEITAVVGKESGDCADYRLLDIEIIDRSTVNKDHYGLKFNIDWIADSDQVIWLASVLSRNSAENIWNAKNNKRRDIQTTAYDFGRAIGLNIHKLD